jgi:hypothetical protein
MTGVAETVQDVGDWVWGLIQGGFNEQQSISQLLVDAVIGMIPVVGDVTAVRDLIAVVLRLIEHPEKRDDCHRVGDPRGPLLRPHPRRRRRDQGRRPAGPARRQQRRRAPRAGPTAIIEVINRFGRGDAAAFFRRLDLNQYTATIRAKFAELLARLDGVLASVTRRFRWVLPNAMLARMQSLRDGIAELRRLADRMIPQAIQDLSARLTALQRHIHQGEWEAVPSSLRSATRESEARLVDTIRTPHDTPMWRTMPFPPTPKERYVHAIGWPDLRVVKNGDTIATFSGEITPTLLPEGTRLRRVVTTGSTGSNDGLFWMRAEDMPRTGPAWRKDFAVLDDWSSNGSYIEIVVPPGGLRVWEGKIASQIDNGPNSATRGQYLEGGATQLVVDFRGFAAQAEAANDAATLAFIAGVRDSPHIPTRWTGLMGINVPDRTADAMRLGDHEVASKIGQNAQVIRGAVTVSRPAAESGTND